MSDRIPFVQRVRTATGTRLYFRRGDVRRRLTSADNSAELRAEVDAILGELKRVEDARIPRIGTLGGALNAYARSADFLSLARSTQSSYQRLIDEIVEDAGDVLLGDVTPGWIDEMKGAWAVRGHRAANLRLQVLLNGIHSARLDGRITPAPFEEIKRVRRPHDAPEPNPVWSENEVEAVIAEALQRGQPGLARAVALGRWGGFRRSTICALPLHARIVDHDPDGRSERRLRWRTEKGRVLCDKREDGRLSALLARTPDRALTVAYNRRSQPWIDRQLNQAVDRLIAALAARGLVRPELTLHGLRHTRGVELALAGASDSEIMSQLEHADSRTAQIYRRQADRRRMADAGQDKIDEAQRRRAGHNRQAVQADG